jgi:hypothetical protein
MKEGNQTQDQGDYSDGYADGMNERGGRREEVSPYVSLIALREMLGSVERFM